MENVKPTDNSNENFFNLVGGILSIGKKLLNNLNVKINGTDNELSISLDFSKDENKDKNEFSRFGQCDSYHSDSNSNIKVNTNKNEIGFKSLAFLLDNKIIINFLKRYGVNIIKVNCFKYTINTEIKNLGYCYVKMTEIGGSISRKDKYNGEGIVYTIIKNEDTELNNEIFKGKSENEVEEYYKENFDIKYEGKLKFWIPHEEDEDLIKIMFSSLLRVKLDGTLTHSKKSKHSFYCYGHIEMNFFIKGENLSINQTCQNVIFILDGEYYKGNLNNFEKTGKGIYINKKGLRIEGNFIDNDTIDGLVDIYDKNYNILEKQKKYEKAKTADILKKYEEV